MSSKSSFIGIVNGWWAATKRSASSFHSRSGNSVIQRSLNSSEFTRLNIFASLILSCPIAVKATSFLSAMKNIASPALKSIAFLRAASDSALMNLANDERTEPSSFSAYHASPLT